MKLKCQCGHPQVLHMGPTGPCHHRERDEMWTPVVTEGEGPKGDRFPRCSCKAFVLESSERERADLG